MNSAIKHASISTTCPYCGVGCGVDATVAFAGTSAAELLSVGGTPEHPANFGKLCVKGSALHEAIGTSNRLLHPELYGARVSWDAALATVAERFSKIIAEHGPDAVAFYLSGQLLTEDYYVANKLMKGFIGSANVDTNSRLCMSSAVTGYKRAFGADAVPCNYEDLELCDLLVMTGSNAAWTHPVLYQRISAAKARNPNLRVVAIDPRRTASCDLADIHLALQPGSDAFLFNGLLAWLHTHGHFDSAYIAQHCDGLDALLAAASCCTPAAVNAATGLPQAQLEEFFRLFAATPKALTFYSQGINQSATGSDKCNAIINCHLVTGRIGKPGMGPFSITGQPNAMGGREVGGLANQLAAHMDFAPEHIERVGRFWQAPRMAQQQGLKAVDMFRAIREGSIKAVWIMGTNPVVSLPKSEGVKEALRRCEFVVVSDCVRQTETTTFAHLLLPATGWSEKDGTVTNSERRISRQRALLIPSGEARHDWQIVSAVARRMGYADAFAYQCPRDIFVEHAALSGFENGGMRAFDISALQTLSAAAYEHLAPVQWPVTPAQPRGTARLFTDGRYYTPNGRAQLLPISATLPAVSPTAEHPYLLNTGRLRDQWHTMTRTGEIPRLLQHAPAPFVAVHPDTAAALHCRDGNLLAVQSPNGELLLPLKSDAGQKPAEVFIPIHWNARFASNARVSKLLDERVDPHSGQPESKLQAVALQAVPMAQWFAIVSASEFPTAAFAYWHARPIPGGHCYQLAHASGLDLADIDQWQQNYPGTRLVEFHDRARHDHRILFVSATRVLAAIFSAEHAWQLPAAEWLQALLTTPLPLNDWQLLAGREQSCSDKGPLICSCHEVGRNEIITAIREGASDHVELGRQLRCGTNCGSCIPELKQLLALEVPAAREARPAR